MLRPGGSPTLPGWSASIEAARDGVYIMLMICWRRPGIGHKQIG